MIATMLKCEPVNKDWRVKSNSLKNHYRGRIMGKFSLLSNNMYKVMYHSVKNNSGYKRFFLIFQSKHTCH